VFYKNIISTKVLSSENENVGDCDNTHGGVTTLLINTHKY
jgi:hypothetical protein